MSRTAYEAAEKILKQMHSSPRRRLIETALNIYGQDNPQSQINALHDLMDTPNPGVPTTLSPADRYRRLHYILSEFLELVDASGFRLFGFDSDENQLVGELNKSNLQLHIKAGNPLGDEIEMLDGLADIMVVCLGMSSEMGRNLMPVFDEVVAASVTKLQPDGFIRKNQCCDIGCSDMGSDCDDPDHFEIPDEPAGKWIKGPNYCPPQIAAIIGEIK